MWEPVSRGEPRGVAGWLLGPGARRTARGPGFQVAPAPALTLTLRWPLLAVQGISQFLEAVGQMTSSFRSHPQSCVELCEDSAQKPGRRHQCPFWLPWLGHISS